MIKHKHECRCCLPAWLAAKDKAGGSISLVKCEFCILLADSFAGVECSAWSVGRPILAQPTRKILASENLISCRPSTVALQCTRRPSNKALPALVSPHYIHMALHNLAFQPPAASPAAALHCGTGNVREIPFQLVALHCLSSMLRPHYCVLCGARMRCHCAMQPARLPPEKCVLEAFAGAVHRWRGRRAARRGSAG